MNFGNAADEFEVHVSQMLSKCALFVPRLGIDGMVLEFAGKFVDDAECVAVGLPRFGHLHVSNLSMLCGRPLQNTVDPVKIRGH